MTRGLLVTIKIANGDSRQVAFELASATGKEVEFLPYNSSQRFNFVLIDHPLWELLLQLSQSGTLKIGGMDFEDLKKIHDMLVSGRKVSMCIHGASVESVASHLSFLSGIQLSIVSGDAARRFSATFKEATFDEIIIGISERTGSKLEVAGVDSLKGTPKSRAFYYSPLLVPVMALWMWSVLGTTPWL